MKKDIVLKSINPSEYKDKIVTCDVMNENDILKYIRQFNYDDIIYAYKNSSVNARLGKEGQKVNTVLYVNYENKKYILSETNNVIKKHSLRNGIKSCDIIVTNIRSLSNEQYIIDFDSFHQMYKKNYFETWDPISSPRFLIKADRNMILSLKNGYEIVCLKDSYIIIYDIEAGDYMAIDQDAFESTYTIVNKKIK